MHDGCLAPFALLWLLVRLRRALQPFSCLLAPQGCCRGVLYAERACLSDLAGSDLPFKLHAIRMQTQKI